MKLIGESNTGREQVEILTV